MLKINFSKTSHKVITPQGGLAEGKSLLAYPPGQMVDCLNFELIEPNSWRRPNGYERYDGQISPSQAEATALEITTGDTSAVVGDDITIDAGAGHAILLEDFTPANDHIALFAYTGTVPTNGSVLTKTVGGGSIGTCGDLYEIQTAEEAIAYKESATEQARLLITELPGEDPPLAAWSYKGVLYAFRNVTGSASAKMYKATSTGWVEVDTPTQLWFDSGDAADITKIPVAGDTVTNGTATGTIHRIQKTSSAADGPWVGSPGTAVGVLHLINITGGTFSNTDSLTFSSTATAIATADQAEIVIAPDGRYEFDNYNFTGAAEGLGVFGVDGANPAFAFDGYYLSQIFTGLDDDTPEHLFLNNFQMFVSKEGSWMVSPIADPFQPWENIRGADEWGMGDKIVGAVVTPGGTVVSFARNSISIIYQNADGTYSIKPYSSEFGAIEWSAQNSIAPLFISDKGLTLIGQSDRFGDFDFNSIDGDVKRLISDLKEYLHCTVTFRNKLEYRMFFEGGQVVRCKFTGGKIHGFTVDAYPIDVRRISESIRSDRYLTDTNVEKDHVFFCSDDGYIRQMDVGDSHDGEEIFSYMELPWNHMGAPRIKKKWYDVILEVEPEGNNIEIGVRPIYNMHDPLRSDVPDRYFALPLPEGKWSEVKWSEFFWAGAGTGGMYKVRLRGVSPGVGLAITSKGGGSYIIKSITTRFSPRGEVR
ncbi:MAG: hypothetical protein KAS93_08120 [Gammaproteobacteria bacterium]|nr:hypothetical protein [Gammaproteobacteria bacterium]